MGSRNRQRRAEKRKRREETVRQRRAHHDGASGRAAPVGVDEFVCAAVECAATGNEEALDPLVRLLGELAESAGGRADLSGSLDRWLQRAVRGSWERGWQPAELCWVVGRRLSGAHRRLAVAGVRAGAGSYLGPGVAADASWVAQLREVGADGAVGGPALHLDPFVAREALERLVRQVVEVVGVLSRLPPQPRLCAPPSAWRAVPGVGAPEPGARAPGADAGSRGDRVRLLARVRALLAKAEATPYPEEAEALSVKAQELMARHAIDAAALEDAGDGPAVLGRRILIDDPYAGAKAILLQTVAEANRSRSVWEPGLGFSTVFGVTDDLETTEVLYTSLLAQATAGLLRAGVGSALGRQARTPSFRQSFLVTFAHRIMERLNASVASAVEDGVREHGDRLLPVLARRRDAVDDAVGTAFGPLQNKAIRAGNLYGRAAGRAADLARLAVGEELSASA